MGSLSLDGQITVQEFGVNRGGIIPSGPVGIKAIIEEAYKLSLDSRFNLSSVDYLKSAQVFSQDYEAMVRELNSGIVISESVTSYGPQIRELLNPQKMNSAQLTQFNSFNNLVKDEIILSRFFGELKNTLLSEFRSNLEGIDVADEIRMFITVPSLPRHLRIQSFGQNDTEKTSTSVTFVYITGEQVLPVPYQLLQFCKDIIFYGHTLENREIKRPIVSSEIALQQSLIQAIFDAQKES